MSFIPTKDFRHEETQTLVLAPSLTFYVGDVVAVIANTTTPNFLGTGYLEVLDNQTSNVQGAKYPIGVLVGFTDARGEVLGQGQNGSIGPIFTQNGQNYLTTASTNVTSGSANYYGVFLPITPLQNWIGDLSAAAVTTEYSNQPFAYFELNDARTVLETSAVSNDNIQSTSQILSLGLVEDENQPVVSGVISRSKIYCKIIKSSWTRQA
jgi:hypothetical protein